MGVARIHVAQTVEDALERVASGFVPLAGGTDLVPRLRHGLLTDVPLVVIRNLAELRGIRADREYLWVGAATPLGDVARSPTVSPWLRAACGEVASPRVRELATIGGALVQARRCRFLNRPPQWRAAAGRCLRTGGDRCLAGGARCVAQQRSLLSTLLLAADARACVAAPAGESMRPLAAVLEECDARDGQPTGVLTGLRIPLIDSSMVAVEWVRRRQSIDHHDLVVAGVRRPEGCAIAVGSATPYPRRVLVSDHRADVLDAVRGLIPAGQPGRFSPLYLRHAAAVLVGRVIARLFP